MSTLSDKIKQLVIAEAPEFGLFLVGEYVAPGNLMITYFMDCEGPLQMNVLTSFSRHINTLVDEGEFGEKKFTLEISSPGADKPLVDLRQFHKHLTRNFEIEEKSGNKFIGKLVSIEDNKLTFELFDPKKKKPHPMAPKPVEEPIPTAEIEFSEIASALVQISFK